ncbi:unnamed protein product [Cylindrotheca closterium]|uniref:Thioredoxin-like fold domain-containing protein n=1 Tax=Cylindrotheca closterium TaxID=2856 RepID=A0AAD2G2P0_9STRA|nr:unnamed protein product [Cylindrotheca closterium]
MFHPSRVLLSTLTLCSNHKRTWKVFWDLQCPFARKNFYQLPELKQHFSDEFDISVHLTSLAFHPQAFVGQRAAKVIEKNLGEEKKFDFINACMDQQDLYTNDAVGDYRKSEIENIFANIAVEAGISIPTLIEQMNDWDLVKESYAEHKVALGYGVFGTPKHVIDEKLVADTESDWGVDEWKQKIEEINGTGQ